MAELTNILVEIQVMGGLKLPFKRVKEMVKNHIGELYEEPEDKQEAFSQIDGCKHMKDLVNTLVDLGYDGTWEVLLAITHHG